MSKAVLLLTSLVSLLALPNSRVFDKSSFNSEYFNITSKEIISVKDEHKNDTELRVYASEDYKVESINSEAFRDCSKLESIMLSKTVKTLPNDVFDGLVDFAIINYTGSIEEFQAIGYSNTNNYVVNDYACDEGFLNFWNAKIRPTEDSSLCDISRDIYNKMEILYNKLSDDDIHSIKDIADGDSTIEKGIKYLREFFSDAPQETKTKEASKSTMIVLILIIASIGMTFICVFYLLRERKIIN